MPWQQMKIYQKKNLKKQKITFSIPKRSKVKRVAYILNFLGVCIFLKEEKKKETVYVITERMMLHIIVSNMLKIIKKTINIIQLKSQH